MVEEIEKLRVEVEVFAVDLKSSNERAEYLKGLIKVSVEERRGLELQVGDLKAANERLNRMISDLTIENGGLQKQLPNDQPFIPPGQEKFDVDMKIDPAVIAFSWVDKKTGKVMHRMSDGTVREPNDSVTIFGAKCKSQIDQCKCDRSDKDIRVKASSPGFHTFGDKSNDPVICRDCKKPIYRGLLHNHGQPKT